MVKAVVEYSMELDKIPTRCTDCVLMSYVGNYLFCSLSKKLINPLMIYKPDFCPIKNTEE
jgi:hypothetical protein